MKKFVVVQIDGLSYETLKLLLKKKHCKTLSMLLKRGYRLYRYNCGIPATTPYIQAGIMYGYNSEIPGFRLVDKKNKKMISFGICEDAKLIEEKLFERFKLEDSKKRTQGGNVSDIKKFESRQGILRNGSSYMNEFSGDANKNVLVMSKCAGLPLTHESISAGIITKPIPFIKVVYCAFKEFLVEIFENFLDIFWGVAKKRHFNLPFFYPYFPFYRFLTNSVTSEIVSGEVLKDIRCGVPYIYATFSGYDSVAHYRGPRTRSAFAVVKDIDKKIKKIYRAAKNGGYDFYVLSDHGSIDAVPFEREYYIGFDEYIEGYAKGKVSLIKEEENRLLRYLIYHIKHVKREISMPLKFFAKALLIFLMRGIAKEAYKKSEGEKWENKKQIFISYSSSLAHIYFNLSDKKVGVSQIEANYPGLVDNIVKHPGIGVVICRDNDKLFILNKFGKVILDANGNIKAMEGKDFLDGYCNRHTGNERNLLIKQIKKMADAELSGDLICVGEFFGDRIVSFEGFHLGSHDSFGGEQCSSFIISKRKLPSSALNDSSELYRIFNAYHN